MKLRAFPCTAVVCAVVFVGTVLLPHALQRLDSANPFRGVEIMAADAEIHYAARMREVFDGFLMTGNVYYSEPKHQPFLHPPYPEAVPAVIAMVLHTDPVLTFTLYAGLCAFVLFLVMTGAMVALTGRRWESLMAVCALVFAGALLGAPWDIGKFLVGSGAFEPLRFSRVINPLWSASWFFGVIWLVATWVRRRDRRLLLACVPCLAILVYSYVYAWSFLAVSLALLMLWYAVRREWPRVMDLCLCGGLVAVVIVPYLLQVQAAVHHPFYAESSPRIGLVFSHAPSLGVWAFIALAILAVARKRWAATWPLLLCLILGGLVAMNQQVLTGHSIVPHHYHWYFFHPLASLLAMVLVLQFLGRFSLGGNKPSVAGFLIVAAMVFGIRYQELAYVSVRAYWGEQQKLAPMLEYVGKNLHAGQVVYSPDIDVMDLVPVYTSADVYTATNANNYLIPTNRIRDVFFFDLWVNGFTAAQAEKEFPTTMRARLGSALYSIYFREQYGSYNAMPDDLVAQNVAAYKSYLGMLDTAKIRLHPINALVLPDDMKETPAISLLKSMSDQVFASEGFSVRMMKSR